MKKYTITERQRANARRIGVQIEPSKTKGKKIDVYQSGRKVASIGARGYKDYDAYLEESLEKAETRRRLYKARHESNRHEKGTPGYFADQILW